MRSVKVITETGYSWITDINGTNKSINKYFLNNMFAVGMYPIEKMEEVTKVIFLDSFFEFKVKSKMYNITDCVVDIMGFMEGKKVFPCGSGEDYRLTEKDIDIIKKYFNL